MNKTQLPFHFVSASQPAEHALSLELLANASSQLDAVTIWCANKAVVQALRVALIQRASKLGLESFRLPNITTLADWVWQQSTPSQPIISELNKQLIVVDALRQSGSFFHTHNLWQLADELVGLFNECTLAMIPLNDGYQALDSLLHQSYTNNASSVAHISRESEILYRLWQAYQEQIAVHQGCDSVQYYANYLIQAQSLDKHHYYVLNQHRFHACEATFLQRVASHHRLKIFYPDITQTHPTYLHHPHCKYLAAQAESSHAPRQALDIIFDSTQTIPERIAILTETFPHNPLADKLALFCCNSIETHAQAVCLQAKRWISEARNSIAILANDRLLIRRIRAVLEEQGIQAHDLGGWSFATTSAATSIETVIAAIDQNFNKVSLLNLLGSPFLIRDEEYLRQYFLFKRQLKKRRNLSTDTLGTFRTIAADLFTTEELLQETKLTRLLQQIAEASQELQTLRVRGEHKLTSFNQGLFTLLQALGIQQQLAADAAGEQLLVVLETANNQLHGSRLKVQWQEWRQWLRNTLEQHYFIPRNMDKTVTLGGLEHIDQVNFDHVILAGVEEYRLLKQKNKRTFFNEKVRYELGLTNTAETNAINFIRFKKLIEQSRSVLLTAELEQHNEPVALSPWVGLIQLFMQQSYQYELENTDLARLLAHQPNNASELQPILAPQPEYPSNTSKLRLSATQYQSLMDCPYQYFAKYVLQLKDDELSDDLQAVDYGQLVHACLQEFYFGSTPADFVHMTQTSLCELLTNISERIFLHTSFPAVSQRAWLKKWQINIPSFVDWAINRYQAWQPICGEQSLEQQLSDTVSLHGQLDRVDQQQEQLGVIDYKTGSTASRDSVLLGETVQLPFYALLDNKIKRTEYVALNKPEQVKSIAIIQDEQLETLTDSHQERLHILDQQLNAGHKLPANGDQTSCRYCQYQGLCRKPHWH